ncbi:glycosyltransferase family 25 protein [Paracoccaceae bacterium Fryx2]|nr:glycosyltransferase family 25 protein [Paracoccaceae bacterium Fryx2]
MANAAAILDAQGIPFTRLDAVHGKTLRPAVLNRVYDPRANRARARHPLVLAEIGCYLSHIAAWQAIADGDAPGGFIFEDDFAASGDLASVLAALSRDAAGDWDMVKLFAFDTHPRVVSQRALGDGHRLVIPYRVPTCLLGYGLTQAAARHLAGQALPFFRPVDEDQKFFWETGLRVALVLPTPLRVGDQQTVTGTIGSARRAAGKSGLASLLRGLRYQIGYRARLHWHRLRGGAGQ